MPYGNFLKRCRFMNLVATLFPVLDKILGTILSSFGTKIYYVVLPKNQICLKKFLLRKIP